jgi:hypothetical protein
VTRPVGPVLQAHAIALTAALHDWDARGTTSGGGPNAAANAAIALMDAMLAELHRARARVDELLRRCRPE